MQKQLVFKTADNDMLFAVVEGNDLLGFETSNIGNIKRALNKDLSSPNYKDRNVAMMLLTVISECKKDSSTPNFFVHKTSDDNDEYEEDMLENYDDNIFYDKD